MQRDWKVVMKFEKATQPLNDHSMNNTPSPHDTSTSWILLPCVVVLGQNGVGRPKIPRRQEVEQILV